MTSPTDPRRFLYRADALDPDLAQQLAREALAKADDGELYLQYRATESFGFDDGRLKTADYSTDAGFGLRAVSGEMTGFAHASDISAGAIRRAAEPLAQIGSAHLFPSPPPAPLLQPADRRDPELAHKLAREALAKADDGELYLQYRATESFGFDDGRLKTADYSTDAGFGLRAVSGEMTGFAHASDISAGAIRRAAETLALLDPAKAPPAPPPARTNRHLYDEANPLDLIPFAKKVDLCQRVDAAARARDPRVAQVSVALAGSWSVVEIVRADGFLATDIRPLVRLNVSIVVEENGRRESGYFGLGGRYMYDHLFEEAQWNRAIDEALNQALVNLRAVDAPAGEMTVLLGPGWPGVLLHEAVGHGLE